MKTFDVAFGQRGSRRLYYDVEAPEVVRRFDNVVYRRILAQQSYRLRFEYPTRLFLCQAAAFDVIGIVCKINLQAMVNAVLCL